MRCLCFSGWWRSAAVLAGWLAASLALPAAEAGPATGRDTLAYKDGDRVHGTFLREEGGVLVFKSDRFGELKVPANEAVVIKGDAVAKLPPSLAPAVAKPPEATPVPAAAKAAAKAAADRVDEERLTLWDRFSPVVLTARVRNFFGPWHGRISFSTEVVTDVADHENSSYEATFRRKWTADEVQINGRYDYGQVNKLTTADLIKATGQWRHEFGKSFFTQYRPTCEWNRASLLLGQPNDYVVLQQELGLGYQLVNKPSRKVRLGVSQNRFDTWNSPVAQAHTWRGAQSAFEETEFNLPWRITISQRGVWYPVRNQIDGWENRFDLIKKLTETLSASLRHEIRRHNPDGSAIDYTKLKLLLGLDF